MSSGKSLAMALEMSRRNKKKMAKGGSVNESAKSEQRPMPEERDKDSKMVGQNSGKKALQDSDWSSRVTERQAQKPSITKLSRPSMVESSVIKPRLSDDVREEILRQHEEHLMRSMPPSNDKDQPDTMMDEKSANRQGTKVHPMKMMAKGGDITAVEESRPSIHEEDNDRMDIEHNSGMHSQDLSHQEHPGDIDSMSQPTEEEQIEHQDSIAAAIMARRGLKRMASGGTVESGSEDMNYADGGEVDLSRNADEDPNMEDQMSFNALKKENYSESEGLDQLDQPKDSNETGDSSEESNEDEHDMTSKIRSKMNMKRQFKTR